MQSLPGFLRPLAMAPAIDSIEMAHEFFAGVGLRPVMDICADRNRPFRILIIETDIVLSVINILWLQCEAPPGAGGIIRVFRIELAAQLPDTSILQRQILSVCFPDLSEREGFRVLIFHVVFSWHAGLMRFMEADLNHQFFIPVLLFQCPGIIVATKSLTADFHNGFFLIVSLAVLQCLHNPVVFFQGDPVFIQAAHQLSQFFRVVCIIHSNAGVIVNCQRNSHLFNNLLMSQQRYRQSNRCNQYHDNRQNQSGRQFFLHFCFSFRSTGGDTLKQPGITVQSGQR